MCLQRKFDVKIMRGPLYTHTHTLSFNIFSPAGEVLEGKFIFTVLPKNKFLYEGSPSEISHSSNVCGLAYV